MAPVTIFYQIFYQITAQKNLFVHVEKVCRVSQLFRKTDKWDLIENARVKGYKKTGDYVRRLKEMFDNGRVSAKMIERELMPKVV